MLVPQILSILLGWRSCWCHKYCQFCLGDVHVCTTNIVNSAWVMIILVHKYCQLCLGDVQIGATNIVNSAWVMFGMVPQILSILLGWRSCWCHKYCQFFLGDDQIGAKTIVNYFSLAWETFNWCYEYCQFCQGNVHIGALNIVDSAWAMLIIVLSILLGWRSYCFLLFFLWKGILKPATFFKKQFDPRCHIRHL